MTGPTARGARLAPIAGRPRSGGERRGDGATKLNGRDRQIAGFAGSVAGTAVADPEAVMTDQQPTKTTLLDLLVKLQREERPRTERALVSKTLKALRSGRYALCGIFAGTRALK